MNEENVKAIELNDDEMDKVTGGAAVLMHLNETNGPLWEARCDVLNSSTNFFNFYHTGAMGCSHFRKKDGVILSWKVCAECKNFHYFDMTKGENDTGTIQDIKYV